MSRPLSADIVELPTLTGHEAHSLATSLEAAARDEKGHLLKTPETVKETFEELLAARDGILEALGGAPPDEAKVRPVDIRIDRIMSAWGGVLENWAKLADEIPEGDTAEELRARLFADGLGFITIAPREEWSEIEQRLKTIERAKLQSGLDSLGLKPLLAHLRKVHILYGEVTGATAQIAEVESPRVRKHKKAVEEAIREYVLAVLGQRRKSRPETLKLADTLLRPLATWESKRSPKKAKEEPKPAPAAAHGEPR